jgi:hypothetical protein
VEKAQTKDKARPEQGRTLLATSDEGEFAARLLKANDDLMAALANSYLRDEEQRNAVVIYAAQLKMFDMVEELEELVAFLNGGLSINMASRAQALQASAGIVFPQISGMKASKEEMRYIAEANKAALENRTRERGDGDKEKD